MESRIVNSDFVVQAHSLLAVDALQKRLVIDQSPASLMHGDASKVPLLFSPDIMPFDVLSGMMVWSCSTEPWYMIQHTVLTQHPILDQWRPLVPALVRDLTSADSRNRCEVLLADPANVGRLQLLCFLESRGLVHKD
jgi:hypothetical protein